MTAKRDEPLSKKRAAKRCEKSQHTRNRIDEPPIHWNCHLSILLGYGSYSTWHYAIPKASLQEMGVLIRPLVNLPLPFLFGFHATDRQGQ